MGTPSGAYIFRPNGRYVPSNEEVVLEEVLKGPVLHELRVVRLAAACNRASWLRAACAATGRGGLCPADGRAAGWSGCLLSSRLRTRTAGAQRHCLVLGTVAALGRLPASCSRARACSG